MRLAFVRNQLLVQRQRVRRARHGRYRLAEGLLFLQALVWGGLAGRQEWVHYRIS